MKASSQQEAHKELELLESKVGMERVSTFLETFSFYSEEFHLLFFSPQVSDHWKRKNERGKAASMPIIA